MAPKNQSGPTESLGQTLRSRDGVRHEHYDGQEQGPRSHPQTLALLAPLRVLLEDDACILPAAGRTVARGG